MKKSQRATKPELIDLGPAYYTQDEYEDCLGQLGRIGRFLGGNRATLNFLSKLSPPETILDIGCGGGQFTIELAKYFSQAHITGIDISSSAIEFAKKEMQKQKVTNLTFETSPDVEIPYPSNSFDIVTSTLVCHHLSDHQLPRFLKGMCDLASKFVVINDLHRHSLAYLGFAPIAKVFFHNRLILHDGLLSIQKSFKKQDWLNYLKAANIPLNYCSITWHWAFRWLLCIDTSFKTIKR